MYHRFMKLDVFGLVYYTCMSYMHAPFLMIFQLRIAKKLHKNFLKAG